MWYAVALIMQLSTYAMLESIRPAPFDTEQLCRDWQASTEGKVEEQDLRQKLDQTFGPTGYKVKFDCLELEKSGPSTGINRVRYFGPNGSLRSIVEAHKQEQDI